MDLQSALNSYNQSLSATQSAQQNLQNFQASQKSASDFYNQAQQQYNIPGLTQDVNNARQAVSNTQSLINNLPGAVNQQVRGQMVGEGQRQGLLGNQMAPLQAQYNTQNNAYGNAQGLYQTNLQQAMNQANMGYQGQLQQYSQLNDIYKNAMAQQEQQAQAYQFWKNFTLNQQSVQAQAAQYAAQTAAIQQQMRITQAQYDLAKAAADKSSAAAATSSVNPHTYTDTSGKALGFDNPNGLSQLTNYGMQQQNNQFNNLSQYGTTSPNPLDIIGKYGPMALLGKGWAW